jgi:hypothetical protein
MAARAQNTAQLENSVVERLSECLAPNGWSQHHISPGDVVAFVREPTSACTWHFSVNLAGDQGITLYCSVGVKHAVVAEEQRRLYGWERTVCQVGASMLNLVHDAEQPSPSPLRWWVASLDQVDEAVAQVVLDLRTYGEPFLGSNLTLPQIVQTLSREPKSQVEYGTLALCHALLGDLRQARAMLTEFGTAKRVFAGGQTETFTHNFARRFGV